MTKDRIETEMASFTTKYKKIDKNNSEIVISEFESKYDEWVSIVPYKSGYNLYGVCLFIYSQAISLESTFDRLNRLASFISEFENYEYSPHVYHKELYYHLGMYRHKLDKIYDNKAVEAFKKYIFYDLGLSSNKSYSIACYSFKRCSKYLYQALIKEQINLSSPSTFNDPFDSPIIALLDYRNFTKEEKEIAKLIRKAYLDCVKVACFVSNVVLPFEEDPNNPNSDIVCNKQKGQDNIPEYKNVLMWAHYADYHTGICIKYHFPNALTQLKTKPNVPVQYFRDIEYKEDLSVLSKDYILTKDAFFAKSKAWEYENELRLLQCDLNSESDHAAIDIPNSVEAIYFGVRCPQRDIDTIMEIMKNRLCNITELKLINGEQKETIACRKPIEFYKMEFDPDKFGSLTAVPIEL